MRIPGDVEVTLVSGVFHHNAKDVLSLVGFSPRLQKLLARDDHNPDDGIAVGRWHERIGDHSRALRMYDDALPWLEGGDDWTWVARRSAMLRKKEGARDEAVSLWRRLWQAGDGVSGVELARHFEHHARDLDEAEGVVCELNSQPGEDVGLLHRLARIQREKAAGRNLAGGT